MNNTYFDGVLTDHYTIQKDVSQYKLKNNDRLKIRKTLSYSFQSWLESLGDDAYFKFIRSLNQLDFSIFDILYCHNFASFLPDDNKKGVNFLMFDNTVHLCSVHHHFDYLDVIKKDRFEFTMNTGKRIILQCLQTG